MPKLPALPYRCTGQSTVELESVVQAEGLVAVFDCQGHDQISAIIWLLNQTELSVNSPPPGVIGIGTTMLIIPATTMYNGSVVQCVAATLATGFIRSPNATLTIVRKLIQLEEDSSLIWWTLYCIPRY